MKVCGFYTDHRDCGKKDFLYMMTYAIALPTLVLFALQQNRAFASFGAFVHFVLLFALIIPTQAVFLRNVSEYLLVLDLNDRRAYSHGSAPRLVSFAVFMMMFILVHYVQEKTTRRMVEAPIVNWAQKLTPSLACIVRSSSADEDRLPGITKVSDRGKVSSELQASFRVL